MSLAAFTRVAALAACAVLLGGCWMSLGQVIPAGQRASNPLAFGYYAGDSEERHLNGHSEQSFILFVIESSGDPRLPVVSRYVAVERPGLTWPQYAGGRPEDDRQLLEFVLLEAGFYLVAKIDTRRQAPGSTFIGDISHVRRHYGVMRTLPGGFELVQGGCDPYATDKTQLEAARKAGVRPGEGVGVRHDECAFERFDQLRNAARNLAAEMKAGRIKGQTYRFKAPI